MSLPSQQAHKPTFKTTPKMRPWYHRLTPAAWLLVIVGGLVGVMLLLGLVTAFFGDRDIPFVLPATSTPAVTRTPAASPTPTPTSTPEAWVWWADQMTCDGQGLRGGRSAEWQCLPPQEVNDALIAAYWAWREAIPFYYYELEMTPRQLKEYYTGDILDLQLEFIALVKKTGAMWDGETILREYEVETRTPLVSGCTADGLTCFLGETIQGEITVYEYDLSLGRIVNSTLNPQDRQYRGVNVWRFKYDLEESKWKIEKYEDWVPAPSL